MKYINYLKLVEADPFIANIVGEHAPVFDHPDPFVRRDHHMRWVKQFVPGSLEYIAYRPWSKLDLLSVAISEVGNRIPDTINSHWLGVDYSVYFWIGREPLPRQRSVDPQWREDGSYTVYSVIKHLQNWHAREFPRAPALKWEAVVKTTTSGGVAVSPMKIEIYRFPDNFRLP